MKIIFKRNVIILILFCLLFFPLLAWILIDNIVDNSFDPKIYAIYFKLNWLKMSAILLINVVFFPIVANTLRNDFHFSKKLLCFKKIKRNLLLSAPFFLWSFLVVLIMTIISTILKKGYDSNGWELNILSFYFNMIFIFFTLLIGFLIFSFVKNDKKLIFIALVLFIFLSMGPGSMLLPIFTNSSWFPHNEIRWSFIFLGTTQISALNWLVLTIDNFNGVFYQNVQELIDKEQIISLEFTKQDLYKTIKSEMIFVIIFQHLYLVVFLLLMWKINVLQIKENRLFSNTKGTKAWKKLY